MASSTIQVPTDYSWLKNLGKPQPPKPALIKYKQAPNLLEDYDAIGFAIDNNCLVQYEPMELMQLMVECFLVELHEFLPEYYPEKIIEFDFDRDFSPWLSNSVWDIDRGLIIILDEEKRVKRAIYGFKELT